MKSQNYSDYEKLNKDTISLIQDEYKKDTLPWILGFSGGKDSTALLILLYEALYQLKKKDKRVTIVYCDTGVEIPVVSSLVHNTFAKLDLEAKLHNIPIKTEIVYPKLEERFFSKVVGKGYPPPTNKFRWCTDRLRVRPIQKIYNNANKNTIILLGVRKGESVERDRIINKNRLGEKYYYKQEGYNGTKIFSPIIDYTTENVWNTIINNTRPDSIYRTELKELYDFVGHIHHDSSLISAIGGKGRFGCWTCTVIRKDKAMENLVKNGYIELQPLLNFRNWLMMIRDDTSYRCMQRRNGITGLGPFTLRAREEILTKLVEAQTLSEIQLISEDEKDYILEMWEEDKNNSKYSDISISEL